MTNKEAAEIVKSAFQAWESEFSTGDDWSEEHEACEMAVKALTEESTPVDWIRGYIDRLKDMGVVISIRDAQAVSVMVDKYMMEQNATCGPDYCEIGGTHDE